MLGLELKVGLETGIRKTAERYRTDGYLPPPPFPAPGGDGHLLSGRGEQSHYMIGRNVNEAIDGHYELIVVGGEADGIPYIAQELVGDGWSLKDVIQEARLAGEVSDNWYLRIATFFAAAAAEFDDVLGEVRDDQMVNTDFTELVDDDGGIGEIALA